MQADWPLSLGIALALLAVGVLLGELWSRLRGPRPERRGRRARPHYLLGLNYLVSNQPTHAIRELSRAVRQETDAVEAYLALGNLFRENGQIERAIDIHKSLLHRSGLSEWERTQVLFSLAMDFKKAGLIDRAERSLEEVGQRDPDHLGCLYSLQQIAEESGRWEEALRIHRRIQEVSGAGDEDLLPGLETEWGRALVAIDADAAERHFRAALDLRPDYAPAHFGLGTCVLERAAPEAALEHLQQAVETGGAWALAALEPMTRLVTGTISARLYKGGVFFDTAEDTPDAMPHSLYTDDSSMEAMGAYDHADAEGFLKVLGISAKNLGSRQGVDTS